MCRQMTVLECGTNSLTVWLPVSGSPRLFGHGFSSNGGPNQYRLVQLSFGDALRFGAFRCVSQRSGLTCRSKSGRGFWLGRSHGHRVF
jgi:hypothetical protein